MKTKMIEQNILKKMQTWWKTIKDVKIRTIAEKNTIVTGGCIASMLLKEKVNDYDVYLRTRDAVIEVARYYVEEFKAHTNHDIKLDTREPDRVKIFVKSAGVVDTAVEDVRDENDPEAATEALETPETKEDNKYTPAFLSTNAISLSGKVQIVIRFYGEPEDIHKNYDYVHCTNYWTSWDQKLILNQPALVSLLEKDLKYVGSLYPVCSMFRLRKFIHRGWTVTAGQLLKVAMQISALDLLDPNVLEDQLTGVDVAYFMQLIRALKEQNPERIDAAYLVTLIDRLF